MQVNWMFWVKTRKTGDTENWLGEECEREDVIQSDESQEQSLKEEL